MSGAEPKGTHAPLSRGAGPTCGSSWITSPVKLQLGTSLSQEPGCRPAEATNPRKDHGGTERKPAPPLVPCLGAWGQRAAHCHLIVVWPPRKDTAISPPGQMHGDEGEDVCP